MPQIKIIQPVKITLDSIEGRHVGEFIKTKTGTTPGQKFKHWRITLLVPEESAIMVVPITGNRKTRLAAAKSIKKANTRG